MLAAIDLGTNSARMLVGTVKNDKVNSFWQAKVSTRMGEGLKEQGMIQKETMARIIKALEEFHHKLARMLVVDVDVFATSAARRASNVDELMAVVENIFGKRLRVLLGEEEARLSYEGAISALPDFSEGVVPVVVDIGGGSVEIGFMVQDYFKALSLELGAVRCTETPISDEEIECLLEPMVQMLSGIQHLKFVGVGGTVTTLAAIDQSLSTYDHRRVHNYLLTQQKVKAILDLLSRLSLEERRQLPGLEPARADIIIAGTRIVQIIQQKFQADAIIVSEADLLHGALKRLAMIWQS